MRVLVVDDTVTYRTIVSQALAGIPGVEVVGTAANGRIALQKIEQLRPDLLTLDLEMPEMDGLELLRRLRAAGSDVGAIMLSAHTTQGAHATLQALELGAFDFVVKPGGGSPQENAQRLQQHLRLKIEACSRGREIRAILQGRAGGAATSQIPPYVAAPVVRQSPTAPRFLCKPQVVALGISTGGPQALTRMLPQLPGDLAAPVLIVQHMPPIFTRSLAEDLDQRCALAVREAADGQPIVPGLVLIAPGGMQMKVEAGGGGPVVRITNDPPENSCRPSVDYLFRSVAEVYGGRTLGVLMTGMGSDGAAGFRLLHRQGAALLAQDEASCVVFGMPREPIREGIAPAIPLENMAREIARLVGQGAPVCR